MPFPQVSPLSGWGLFEFGVWNRSEGSGTGEDYVLKEYLFGDILNSLKSSSPMILFLWIFLGKIFRESLEGFLWIFISSQFLDFLLFCDIDN